MAPIRNTLTTTSYKLVYDLTTNEIQYMSKGYILYGSQTGTNPTLTPSTYAIIATLPLSGGTLINGVSYSLTYGWVLGNQNSNTGPSDSRISCYATLFNGTTEYLGQSFTSAHPAMVIDGDRSAAGCTSCDIFLNYSGTTGSSASIRIYYRGFGARVAGTITYYANATLTELF